MGRFAHTHCQAPARDSLVRLPCVRPGPPRPRPVQDSSLGHCSPVGGRRHYVILPRPPSADVAPAQWQRTAVAPPAKECAIVARPPGQNTTVAPLKQPCADVAPFQWQSTTVVPPTYTCAVVA